MDNAGLEKRDREQQYRLSLLRGVPDESLLRSESLPSPVQSSTGRGELTVEFTVTPAPEEKKSELRRSKRKSSGRHRSKQH